MAKWCVLSESQYRNVCQLAVEGHLHDLKTILSEACSEQQASIAPETLVPWLSCDTAPLVLAAQHGHTAIVKYLIDLLPYQCFLDHCATVFDIASRGDELHHVTALNAACIKSYLPIVDLLLKRNASHGVPDCTGATPLNEAAFHGRVDVVNLLCQHGTDLHVLNDFGWEPLHVATFKNHKQVFDSLVQNGVDCTRVTVDGLSVLHIAAARGHIGIVKTILKQSVNLDPLKRDIEKGMLIPSPLCLAAAYGYQSIVNLFCRLQDCTPLHIIDSQLLSGTSNLMKHDYQTTLAVWQKAVKLREQSHPEFTSNFQQYSHGQSEVKTTEDLLKLCGPSNPSHQANMWYQALVIWERCIGFRDMTYWNILISAATTLRHLQMFEEVELMFIRGTKLVDKYLIPQLVAGHILPQNFEVFYQSWVQDALLYNCLNDSKTFRVDNVGPYVPNFPAYLPYIFNAIDVTASRFCALTDLYGCEKRAPLFLLKTVLQLFLVWLYLIDTQHPKIPALSNSECYKHGVEFVAKFIVLADGNTLLHLLLDHQFPHLNILLESLLQWGGDRALNMHYKGVLCLHKACLSGCSPKTVEILLNYGAHFDAVDQQGRTLLEIVRVTHPQLQAEFELFRAPQPLYCLSAFAVIRSGAPYQHMECLPLAVKSFLAMHDKRAWMS